MYFLIIGSHLLATHILVVSMQSVVRVDFEGHLPLGKVDEIT